MRDLRIPCLIVLTILAACTRQSFDGGPIAGWPVSTGSQAGGQYSPLTQIDKTNVRRLQVAWVYQSADFLGPVTEVKTAGGHSSSSNESTPIVVGDNLVFCTPWHRVVALDPVTGKERWNHDPKMDQRVGSHFCRGVAAWSDQHVDGVKTCQQRIFSTTGDGRLEALDLANGTPCADFGIAGSVDLKRNLGPLNPTEYYQTSPPLVYGDLLVTGSAVRDGFRNDTAGGVVRAWDARSGKLVWAWDPVGPETHAVTAADADAGMTFTRGTPNVWSFMAADLEHGLIFLPTGNAPPDHFKGPPRDIDFYGSSVVALDASTGRVVWSFQTVHHDLWDYDVPAQPVLYEHQGQIPALAVSTKMGHIFLLNRLSGRPLFPVSERPVPRSDVPGEWTAPTQPFPSLPKPLLAERVSSNNVMDYPYFSDGCAAAFTSLRNEGMFTPPSLQGTLVAPGISGGLNWGAGSINPQSRVLVTTLLNIPFIVKLVPRRIERSPEQDDDPVDWMYGPQYGAPYAREAMPFLSARGIPCSKPPWGAIVAINLDTGLELWRKPLGSLNGRVPVLGSFLDTGVPVSGGILQTGTGLVFVAASADSTLRSFDSASGRLLWQTELPFSGHATPMTYRLSDTGKQFLVIATGGSTGMDVHVGNTLVAFTLPD